MQDADYPLTLPLNMPQAFITDITHVGMNDKNAKKVEPN